MRYSQPVINTGGGAVGTEGAIIVYNIASAVQVRLGSAGGLAFHSTKFSGANKVAFVTFGPKVKRFLKRSGH